MDETVLYDGYFRHQVKAKFDLAWVRYDSQFVYNQLKFIDRYISLNDLKHRKVLEIGSGLGRLALLLGDRGFTNFTGIELDGEAVNFSQSQLPAPSGADFSFQQATLDEIATTETNPYDVVFCFETLEHLTNPLNDIAQMNAVLNKGGLFIGTTPFPFRKNIKSDESHLFVLHPLNWQRLFERSGFKVIKIKPMTFLPYLWRIDKRLNVILPFYIPGFSLVSTTLIIAEKQ